MHTTKRIRVIFLLTFSLIGLSFIWPVIGGTPVGSSNFPNTTGSTYAFKTPIIMKPFEGTRIDTSTDHFVFEMTTLPQTSKEFLHYLAQVDLSPDMEDNISTSYIDLTKGIPATPEPFKQKRESIQSIKIADILDDKKFLAEQGYDSSDAIPVIIRLDIPHIEKLNSRDRNRQYDHLKSQLIPLTSNKTVKDLKIIGGFSAELTRDEIDKFAVQYGVNKIDLDYKMEKFLYNSTHAMNIDDVWAIQDSLGNNVTGKGVTVVIIDTGIDYNHPDFSPVGICDTCKVIDGYDFGEDDSDPMDNFGHGSLVAGIVAADGYDFDVEGNTYHYSGVAPGSKLIAYKVSDYDGQMYSSRVIQAIERAIDPNQDGDYSDHYDIINLSIGFWGGTPDDPQAVAIDFAVDQGVIVTVAAGNYGSDYGRITTPANARKAIAVGASRGAWSIEGYSSRGPSEDSFKPEVVAVGRVCATHFHNNQIPMYVCNSDRGEHGIAEGTSVAAPHVAGIAALLKQAYPNMSWAEFKSRIMQTTWNVSGDNYSQGAGLVNALDAYNAEIMVSEPGIAFGKINNITTDIVTKEFDITNLKDYELDLVISDNDLSDEEGNEFSVVNVNYSTLNLAPGETKTVRLSIDLTNENIEGFLQSRIKIRIGFHYYFIPITLQSVFTVQLNIADAEGHNLQPNLFYTHNEDYKNVQLLEYEFSEGGTYKFERRRGIYYFYAMGDKNDRELDYIVLKRIDFRTFRDTSLTLSLANAVPITIQAQANDGTPLRIFNFFKHLVTRSPISEKSSEVKTYASSVTELLYGFRGDRTIQFVKDDDWDLETDLIVKIEGVPAITEYTLDWSGDELLNDEERALYSMFYENYKTNDEHYNYGFVLSTNEILKNNPISLAYKPEDYTRYTYLLRNPGGPAVTKYIQQTLVFPLSLNYYPALLYPIYPVYSDPLDRILFMAGTDMRDHPGYYHGWENHTKYNINYIPAGNEDVPEINDGFHNTVHQEETVGEANYYTKNGALIKDFRTFLVNPRREETHSIGKTPYKVQPIRDVQYYSSNLYQKEQISNTHYFQKESPGPFTPLSRPQLIKGNIGDATITKFTEYAYRSLSTLATQEFSFEKPTLYFKSPYSDAYELLVDTSTTYGGIYQQGRWYQNWQKETSVAGRYEATVTIPTLYQAFSHIIHHVEYDHWSSGIPIIEDIEIQTSYENGDIIPVSVRIHDDLGLDSIQFGYRVGTTWSPIDYSHEQGDVYSGVINTAGLDSIDIYVYAVDTDTQVQSLEILNASISTFKFIHHEPIRNEPLKEDFSILMNHDYTFFFLQRLWATPDASELNCSFKVEFVDSSNIGLEVSVDKKALAHIRSLDNWTGDNDVIFTITTPAGLSSSDTINISVLPSDTFAPEIDPIPDLIMLEDSSLTIDISTFVRDTLGAKYGVIGTPVRELNYAFEVIQPSMSPQGEKEKNRYQQSPSDMVVSQVQIFDPKKTSKFKSDRNEIETNLDIDLSSKFRNRKPPALKPEVASGTAVQNKAGYRSPQSAKSVLLSRFATKPMTDIGKMTELKTSLLVLDCETQYFKPYVWGMSSNPIFKLADLLQFNIDTGLVTITPLKNYYQDNLAVKFIVTDLEGNVNQDTFFVSILPVNDQPYVSSSIPDTIIVSTDPEFVIDLKNYFWDIDLESTDEILSYSAEIQDESVGTIEIDGSQLFINYYPEKDHQTDVYCHAKDIDGLMASDTFRFEVIDYDHPPFSKIDIIVENMYEDSLVYLLTENLNAYYSDIDIYDTLHYTANIIAGIDSIKIGAEIFSTIDPNLAARQQSVTKSKPIYRQPKLSPILRYDDNKNLNSGLVTTDKVSKRKKRGSVSTHSGKCRWR